MWIYGLAQPWTSYRGSMGCSQEVWRRASFQACWTLKAFYCLGAQSEWHPGYLNQIVSVDKCDLPNVRAICLFFNLPHVPRFWKYRWRPVIVTTETCWVWSVCGTLGDTDNLCVYVCVVSLLCLWGNTLWTRLPIFDVSRWSRWWGQESIYFKAMLKTGRESRREGQINIRV